MENVRRARAGGHSFGGYETIADAGWDFHRTPGWKGLSALVEIDGGVPGEAKEAPSEAAITARLEQIDTGSPFANPFGEESLVPPRIPNRRE